MKALTRAEVLALPASTDIGTAGRSFGMGLTVSKELARQGRFPVPVLKCGNAWRVPTAPLLTLLGLTPDKDVTGATTPVNVTGTDESGPRHGQDNALRAV